MAFLIAFFLNLALIPVVRIFSFRVGRVAQPRQDRWHSQPTPTLGGVGIFAAFAVTLVIGEAWLPGGQWQSWLALSGSVLLFLVGIWDEFRPMTPAAKLVAQILAATLLVALGYTSTFFSPKLANTLVAQVPNIVLTYVWLIGITNAINFLDNMDGLAGGISLIAALVLSYFFARSGSQDLLWVSLALAGSLLGFLVYNFPPARIFMGDSGSLFLGFGLATLAIAAQKQLASNVFAVMAVPTLLFLLPIFDTVLVTFTRLLRGQSPAQGGRDHTSHRLIAFGLSERQTLLVLYAVAILSGVLAATIESLNYYLSLALVPLVIVGLAVVTSYFGGMKVVPIGQTEPERPLARLMLNLTYRRRVLEVLLDFFVIGLAYYLAFLARYGLVMNSERFTMFWRSLPLVLASCFISFIALGIYRGVWRYISFTDLLRDVQAVLGAVVIMLSVVTLLDLGGLAAWANTYPHVVLGLFAVFLFLGLAATRSSVRLLDNMAVRQGGVTLEPVIIIGSSDAGELLLRWIQMNIGLGYQPIGMLNPDPWMQGRQIHGVQVLGTFKDLERILGERKVDGVILAGIENAAPEVEELRQACNGKCWMRSFRLELEEIR